MSIRALGKMTLAKTLLERGGRHSTVAIASIEMTCSEDRFVDAYRLKEEFIIKSCLVKQRYHAFTSN